MAATAGSVAVGSTIGHGLSSMLFGGSNHAAPAPEAQAVPVQQQQQSTYQAQGVTCEAQAKGAFGHHLWLSAPVSYVIQTSRSALRRLICNLARGILSN